MKTMIALVIAMLSISPTVLADLPNRLPDLDKALAGGKLIHRPDPKLVIGFRYEYASNASFEDLKKELKEFLGPDWKEQERNPRATKAFQKVMKAEGIDIVGMATFSNPAFPENDITLLMKHEKSEEKEWRTVDIFGNWRKNEEPAVRGKRR
jgi:hypothetical protein